MTTQPSKLAKPSTAARAGESQDARTRILAAAGNVFAAQGYEGATVREICSLATANVASVAYYFGDKMGLYRSVIAEILSQRECEGGSELAGSQERLESLEPEESLRQFIRGMLSHMLNCDPTSWHSQIIMREIHQPTEALSDLVEGMFRPMLESLNECLHRVAGRPIPQHRFDQLALSVVGQCLYYRVSGPVVKRLFSSEQLAEHFHLDALAEHIFEVSLAGARAIARQTSASADSGSGLVASGKELGLRNEHKNDRRVFPKAPDLDSSNQRENE
ncbi:MAG: CerR family C-terminal domain-containing protein [Planctomycetota bacterium]